MAKTKSKRPQKKSFSGTVLNDVAGKPVKKTTEQIKQSIAILTELQAFIDPLTSEEFINLRNSILEEGVRDPLMLWEHPNGKYYIADGHHRYTIATQHRDELIKNFGYDFNIKVKKFENLTDVKVWMALNQMGRRNLTSIKAAYLTGFVYNNNKDIEAYQKSSGGTKKSPTHDFNLIKDLSKQRKVSVTKIKDDIQFTKNLDNFVGGDEELKNKILNKQIRVSKTNLAKITQEPREVQSKIIERLKDGETDIKRAIIDSGQAYRFEKSIKNFDETTPPVPFIGKTKEEKIIEAKKLLLYYANKVSKRISDAEFNAILEKSRIAYKRIHYAAYDKELSLSDVTISD